MNISFIVLLVLPIIRRVVSAPADDHKKGDGKKSSISRMYYSLDLSVPMSKSIVVSDKKEIDGMIFRDVTVKHGITVNELYHGEVEVWRAKPNRELMKAVVIENKRSTTYIVVTKDKAGSLAETHIVITNVTMTFSPHKDGDLQLFNTPDTIDERSKNLRSIETQTGQDDKRGPKDHKSPFESKEYMSELLPGFVTKPKFREMDEQEEQKLNP